MSDTVKTLEDFIGTAERSRKYPSNTAASLRSALRLFAKELNDEEKASIDKFKENLERIYRSVFDKNKTDYTTGSLDTYRRRILKLLKDYEKYGKDPAKMNSWTPPVRKPRTSKKAQKESQANGDEGDEIKDNEVTTPKGSTRLDWPLGSTGRKAILVLPADLTEDEAETIKSLVGLRVTEGSVNEKGKSPET